MRPSPPPKKKKNPTKEDQTFTFWTNHILNLILI